MESFNVFSYTLEICSSHLDCVDDLSMGIWIMSLYGRLKKEKDRLGKIVLRSPKTKQELLDRGRWERVTKILTRRYEYGIDTFLDDLRREDHLDEIRDFERMRT